MQKRLGRTTTTPSGTNRLAKVVEQIERVALGQQEEQVHRVRRAAALQLIDATHRCSEHGRSVSIGDASALAPGVDDVTLSSPRTKHPSLRKAGAAELDGARRRLAGRRDFARHHVSGRALLGLDDGPNAVHSFDLFGEQPRGLRNPEKDLEREPMFRLGSREPAGPTRDRGLVQVQDVGEPGLAARLERPHEQGLAFGGHGS